MFEFEWLFNVTCNDISVIYETAHTCRCAGGMKKFDLRLGSKCHRHFVGFFRVPVQAPTRATLFIRLFRETAPFSRLLRHTGDKTPYNNRNVKRATWHREDVTKKFDYTAIVDRLSTVRWSNILSFEHPSVLLFCLWREIAFLRSCIEDLEWRLLWIKKETSTKIKYGVGTTQIV